MRIIYLKLVNYANIMAGLKRKTFEMNLNKSTRKVVLIMGDNGSGKTSILSQLQPFPFTVGDVREGKGIILENEEGYKEIHYDVNGTIYKIKHFISTKGTVKSYISKGGEELNPNGNVRSFEEMVEGHLHINKDTLLLMRLGTNSSTFIKMSSSGRKSFTSDLLSDVNVYASIYKKLNNDYRTIRNIIRNVSSKLEALNIQDIDGFKTSIINMQEYIDSSRSTKETLIGELSILNNKLDEIGGMDQSSNLAKQFSLRYEIEELNNSLEASQGLSVDSLSKDITSIDKVINDIDTELTIKNAKVKDLLDRSDTISYELTDVSTRLQMLTSKGEVAELTVLLSQVDSKIKSLEDRFKGFDTEATLADFKRLLEVYKEIDRIISISHEFDHQAIVNVVALFVNGDNVERYLNKEYQDTVNKLENAKAKLAARQSGKDSSVGEKIIIFKDKNCPCNCPFESFYDEVMSNDSKTVNSARDKVYSIERELTVIDEKFAIMSNINLIKMTVDANATLLSKLPEGSMVFKDIITNMANSLPVYDEKEITSYISLMEDYEKIKELKFERMELKEELSKLRASSDIILELNKSLLKYQDESETLNESIKNYTDEINKLELRKSEELDVRNSLVQSLEHAQKADIIRDEVRVCKEELEEVNSIINTFNQIVPRVRDISNGINNAEENIKVNESRVQEAKRRLSNYNELQDELKILNSKYDKIDLIRDAVSSNKGIPLLYIKVFMADINNYINNLVRRVYGGTLEIDEFVINESEFTIPYFKNGIKVPDISMISQGEETFVSLATTFSFLRRAIGDYNVIGADELDGPLDDTKRHQFLDIIETELEAMNIEQFFLISHNEVFNSYPVDCILTTDKDVSAFKNLKVVYNAMA